MPIGVKSVAKPHSLGNKSAFIHTLGQKKNGVVMSGQNASKGLSTTPYSKAGVGESNLIYNKSNFEDIRYYPMGRKHISHSKKSYLEKR